MLAGLNSNERKNLALTYTKGSDEDRAKLDAQYGRAYISYFARSMNDYKSYKFFVIDLGDDEDQNRETFSDGFSGYSLLTSGSAAKEPFDIKEQEFNSDYFRKSSLRKLAIIV